MFGAAVPGLTYLHLRARTEPERSLTWRDSYAALPFLALGLYVIVSFHILPVEEKRALFETRAILDPVNRLIIPLTADAVWLGFIFASIRTIHRHDKRLLDWFSNLEHRRLSDVRTVLLILCGLILLHILWTLTGASGLGLALNAGHFLLVNVLGIAALRTNPETPLPPRASADRAGLAEGDLQPVWARIDQHLGKDALYLDPDLTVARLARAIGERPRQVSEAINRFSGGSFYDLVNAQRIEAAKARLAAEPDTKILEIAFACGFNSKSAFNTAFKRLTGMTPSAWRAAHPNAALLQS